MEFQEATIDILEDIGQGPIKKQEKGKIAVGTGLGYWIGDEDDEEHSTFYALTHIPTGRKISPLLVFDERIAQQMIEAMAPLLNWNRPLKELLADPNYFPATAKASELFLEIYQKNPQQLLIV